MWNDQEWSVDVLMLIKIPFYKVLPETFPIKRLSELGSFRRESDMRGLTILTLLFIASIVCCGLAMAGADQSYQDQNEERLTKLPGRLPKLRAHTRTKRVKEIDRREVNT